MVVVQSAIEVSELAQRAKSGVVTLHDVTLAIEPGELVAIIGGSGAGKTTLLDTLCGLRPPAAGTVRLISGNIGYVPQDDVIHLALPLARTLRYAAALRAVPGASVDTVLGTLELAGRSLVPVGQLSGGERKRASIASELLAGPTLFFLDEPTSGLDPARGAELMRTLRGLAEAGTTVVLTTHNPSDADRCDKVAVLAPGGRLAFFGPPAEARAHFGTGTLEEIYELLDGSGDPAGPTVDVGYPDGRPGDRSASPSAAGPRPGDRPGGPASRPFRQWLLLTRRNADMLSRSPLTLAILVGAPVMVLLMFLVLFRPGAFNPAQPSPAATVMILFWVAFGGFFFGLTYGLLQICGEFGVLRRERFAGVGASSYVLAKVAVLLPLLAVVDLLFLVVLRALGRLPDAGDYVATFVTLLLSSAAALGLGLLISAAVSEPSQATIALPMLCFPQVLFVGAILPVPTMAVAGRWISYAMTNRWAFEALGHSLGVAGLWADRRSPLGAPLLASYGMTFARPVAADWLILAGFTVAFLAGTIGVVVRKTTVAGRLVPSAASPAPSAVQARG
jgi:ABC-type multidrug transport system ATPase subunit/ABC-type multidrug transport system permease subunit